MLQLHKVPLSSLLHCGFHEVVAGYTADCKKRTEHGHLSWVFCGSGGTGALWECTVV